MFTSIKSICIPGNGVNEDYLGYSETFLFVLDGATILGKKERAEKNQNLAAQMETEASRFVTQVGNYLQLNLSDTTRTIEGILRDAVSSLDIVNIESPESSYRNPSAGLSLFRRNGAMLEYYGLGDCSGTISFSNGAFRMLHDDTLTGLDQKVIQEMINLANEKNIHISDARKLIEPLLIDNRNKKNTKDGYWVLDASGEGICHGTLSTFSIEEIHSVSLMTDGFAGICTTFHMVKNFAELHNRILDENLENIVKELFELQDTDLFYDRFPRFKHRDDTTAIFALIEKSQSLQDF